MMKRHLVGFVVWIKSHIMSRLRPQYEICRLCGRDVGLWWDAPDALWHDVVGDPGTIRCIRCFDLEAEKKGIYLHWTVRRAASHRWNPLIIIGLAVLTACIGLLVFAPFILKGEAVVFDTYISRWHPNKSFVDSAQLVLRGYAMQDGTPDPISVAFIRFGGADCSGGGDLELTWLWRSNAQGAEVRIYEAPYEWSRNITWGGFADVPALLRYARLVGSMEAPALGAEPVPMTVRLLPFDAGKGLMVSLISTGSVEYAFGSSESQHPPRLRPLSPVTDTPRLPTATWEPTTTSWPTPTAWPSPTCTTYLTPVFLTATPEVVEMDCTMRIEYRESGGFRLSLECEP